MKEAKWWWLVLPGGDPVFAQGSKGTNGWFFSAHGIFIQEAQLFLKEKDARKAAREELKTLIKTYKNKLSLLKKQG